MRGPDRDHHDRDRHRRVVPQYYAEPTPVYAPPEPPAGITLMIPFVFR
jgi:hypothetical protein